jgi:hypothetical protein
MYRIAVATAVADIGYEVLGRCDDTESLKLRHKGDTHLGGKKRVFPVSLLGASPADV